MIFLAVLGPGIITANVDNDAGGIYTYSVAGAKYGFSLLWTLIPITIALIIVQEMVAPHGGGDRQRPGGPDPRGIWLSHHLHPDGPADHHRLGEYRIGVCRARFRNVRLPHEPLRGGPAGGHLRVAAGGEGKLPLRGKGLPGGVRDLSGLSGFLLPGASRLDRRRWSAP